MRKWWIAVILALLVAGSAIGVSVAIASAGSSQEPAEEQESQSLSSQAKITAEQAKEAALAASPGATITQVELDNENGKLVWGVEFTNGAETKVDAENGQVVGTEQPEANEADEAVDELDEANDQDEADDLDEANEPPPSQ